MTDPATIERLAREAGIWLFEDLPQVEATIGTLRIFAALIEERLKDQAIDLVAFHGGSVEIEAAIRAL